MADYIAYEIPIWKISVLKEKVLVNLLYGKFVYFHYSCVWKTVENCFSVYLWLYLCSLFVLRCRYSLFKMPFALF